MIQTIKKLVTFDDFIAWYPENSEHRYELHNGVIVKMAQPLGEHEEVTGFLTTKLVVEFTKLKLPYFISKRALVRNPEKDSGYSPDILILNRPNLASEPLWKKAATVTQSTSIPLLIEVVSTNWRDDYFLKFADYEEMGIPEYWMVDYLGLGGKRFIGNPKQATFSVCQLIDGEYQVSQFRGSDRIESPTFPELQLTAEQIFAAGA